MRVVVKILPVNYWMPHQIKVGFLEEGGKYVLPSMEFNNSVRDTLSLLEKSLLLDNVLIRDNVQLANVLDGVDETVYIIYKSQTFMAPSILDSFNNIKWVKYEHLSTTKKICKEDLQIIRRSINL